MVATRGLELIDVDLPGALDAPQPVGSQVLHLLVASRSLMADLAASEASVECSAARFVHFLTEFRRMQIEKSGRRGRPQRESTRSAFTRCAQQVASKFAVGAKAAGELGQCPGAQKWL